MMRKLFIFGTLLFWLCVCSIWIASQGEQVPDLEQKIPAQPATEKSIPLSEVARHGAEKSCWMAINGGVYDFTAYLPEHPSKPAIIVPWCGKEASEAYRSKMKGRSHSPEADRLLSAYRIGALTADVNAPGE